MEQEYFNQRITCHVDSCKYHDGCEKRCTLGEIIVNGNENKEHTFCDSFREK